MQAISLYYFIQKIVSKIFLQKRTFNFIRFSVLFFLLFISININAQERFRGKLVKQKNGRAAVGVQLKVIETEDEGQTDIFGIFTLHDYGEDYDSLRVEVTDKRFEPIQFTVYPDYDLTIEVSKRLEKWRPTLKPIVPSDTLNNSFETKIVPDQRYITAPPHAAYTLQYEVPDLTVTRPGGDPNAHFQIINRGISSATQRNYPLVIVDGMPEMSLERINPEDIASMSVGNSAVSGAEYGMMGGAGVIEVQTMRYDTAMPTLRYHSSMSGAFMANSIPVMSADEYLEYKPQYDEGGDTDWIETITQNGYSHRHHLSFAKGTDRKGIYFSLGHQKENGILKFSGFEQNNARLKMHGVSRSGKTTYTLMGSVTQKDANYALFNAFQRAIFYNPTMPVYDDEGNLTTFTTSNGTSLNPLGYLKEYKSLARTREWTAGLHIQKRTANNWEWDNLFSYRRRQFYSGDSYQFVGKRLDYRAYDRTHALARFGLKKKYEINRLEVRHWGGIESSLIYEKEFLFGERVIDSIAFDFNLLSNPRSVWDEPSVYEADEKYDKTILSGYGGHSLQIDGIEMAGGARYDLLFFNGKNTGKLFFYTRISTNLKPLFDALWISRSKLSLSYGKTGSVVGNGLAFSDHYYHTWGGEYLPERIQDKGRLFEKKSEIDLRLAFAFWENQLTASLNIFHQHLYDQQVGLFNKGEIGNRGISFQLAHKWENDKNLSWQTSLGVSANRTAMYYFGSSPESTTLDKVLPTSDYNEIRLEKDGAIGQIYGFRADTIRFKRYSSLDLDGDNVPDRTIIGQARPSLGITFSSHLIWKRWDFTIRMRSMLGHDLINNHRRHGELIEESRNNVVTTRYFNDGRERGESDLYDVFVENASFLKLDLLSIGFSPTIKKASLRFYLMGENLLTLTKYTGLDPEPRYHRNGIALAGGMEEFDTYFRSRRLTVGVQLALK